MNSILGSRKRALALSALLTAFALLLSANSAEARKDTFVLAKPYNNSTVKKKTKVSVALSKSLKKRAWGVEFWVDGDRVGTDRKAPFNKLIDTRKYENGQHIFRVSLIVKSKGSSSPNRKVCEFIRSIYVNVKNKQSGTAISAMPKLPTPLAGTKQKWTLKFNDEFNGVALDRTKWNDQRDDWIKGGKPYNDRESAFYKPENTTVAGGKLVQTIKAEAVSDEPYSSTVFQRTTGMINGNQKFGFQYGYVEARVKVPSCEGCWPVFWTLPTINTWPPEVDMFEFLDTAGRERRPFIASHFGTPEGLQTALYYYTTPCGTATDYTENYHTYGYLWTPKRLQPFLDGVPGPILTGAAVPHLAMYMVLSLQTVDKNDAGVKFNTPPGASMSTDYIRVWQSNKP